MTRRPPSGSGVPKSRPKQTKVTSISQNRADRANVKSQERRLNAHNRIAKASIGRIRPKISLSKKVGFTVLGSLVLLVVLVIVAVFSPLLAIKKIEIVGAERVSEKEISKDLAFLKGLPLPQVSNDVIVEKLAKYTLIDSVSAVSLPPSTLRVQIVERVPIAIVSINGISYLYDAVGVQLGRASGEKLPIIYNSGDPKTDGNFRQAISILLQIPISLLPRVYAIKATSKDNATLFMRSFSQQVLWGDSSEPGLKARVLNSLLENYKGKYGIVFDVSAPNSPTVR